MDEAGFSTQPARRSTWGVIGSTPVLKIAGRGWTRLSVAGALSVSPGDRRPGHEGRRRRLGQFFRAYDHAIDGPTFAGFVLDLLRAARGKVVLIWDGLSVHRSAPVREVLDGFPRARVHRLPAYAPELNPVEPMWGHAKSGGMRGRTPEDLLDLRIETSLTLGRIARRQHLLRSFCKATPLAIPGITT